MLIGFIFFVAGLLLVCLSYWFVRLSSYFLRKTNESEDSREKPQGILGDLFPWPGYQSANFAWTSVLLFSFGSILLLYGLVVMLGFIDIS